MSHDADRKLLPLAISALGVVYGDIGTSPLYAMRECFYGPHGVAPTPENVLGVLSLIVYALLLVISLKYVVIVMRADNRGEGGILALTALLPGQNAAARTSSLVLLGIFGAALLYGDGMITPAITVLSAMEGLNVATPLFEPYVVPATVGILLGVFAIQRHGTERVGRLFGPIMLGWFAVLAVLGVAWMQTAPQVLGAFDPSHGVRFLLEHQWHGVIVLGAVFLVVTGGEALYADMGHFGKQPIRIAWYGFVAPALVVNYFGQGAMLLRAPETIENPFFMMAPDWAALPLVGLATAATVIASQALITAAFSVTRQAVQLGLLPRMRILHTSVKDLGQIYVPFVNWGLYVFIILAVALFKSSTNLASAYGIAVTLDMTITTIMTFFVIRHGWKYPLWLCLAATGFFFVIDVAFFSSNMLKLFGGGWFPLVIGIAMFTLMLTWQQGRALVSHRLRDEAIDLKSFLDAIFINPPVRVDGTAVFLSAEPGITPNALMHNLKHNKVLHQHNLFVTVRHHDIPWVGFQDRITMESLGHDCWQVTLNFGFKNEPDVPEALKLLEGRGVPLDDMDTSYFLSRDIIMPTLGDGMALWREKLFANMHRNAAAAADFLNLPTNRVVELGSKVEI